MSQSRPLRILYLSQYFPPEVGATQTRAHEMARGLVRAGHHVTVLTEVPNHPSGIIPPAYRGKLWERATLDGIQVIRLWVWAAPDKGFVTRMRFYLSYMLMAIAAGAVLAGRGRHYDVVVATSPPLFVGLAGVVVAALLRTRFVFEVRDLWPESAVALGELGNPQAVRLAEGVARLCYRRARRVVAVTRGITAGLVAQGVPTRKIVLIPNGANVEEFRPVPEEAAALRQRLGLDDNLFVVLYAGIHGLAQGMESLVETARLLQHDPHIRLVFVGAGPKKARVEQLQAEYGLDNLLLIPEQPRAAMSAFLTMAGASLVPLRAVELFAGALPSKMFEALACGTPVILSARGEAAEVLAAAGGGLVVPPEDPPALAAAIRTLAADPATAQAMGARGRAYVVRSYSRAEQAGRLERLLRRVTAHRA